VRILRQLEAFGCWPFKRGLISGDLIATGEKQLQQNEARSTMSHDRTRTKATTGGYSQNSQCLTAYAAERGTSCPNSIRPTPDGQC
jgi:hypothetical protein